ncbi:MAG: nucleotide exchange factor GrpE [bacterium]|jgi:molecular chaperone GrpE
MKETRETGVQGESLRLDSDADSLSEGSDRKEEVSEAQKQEGADWVSQLESKEREIEVLSDRLLRLQAEFENFKKRTAKERAELIKFANEGLLLEMIPILDNLERAINSARENVDIENLLKGLELVQRLFTTFLERAGVKEIRAQGQVFDPRLHEAVLTVESAIHPDNTVVEEIQRGYLLNNRVLRPAMVKVAKALPPEETQDEDEGS